MYKISHSNWKLVADESFNNTELFLKNLNAVSNETMNQEALSFSLTQIDKLVSNLKKKNFEHNSRQIEAVRFFFQRCLLFVSAFFDSTNQQLVISFCKSISLDESVWFVINVFEPHMFFFCVGMSNAKWISIVGAKGKSAIFRNVVVSFLLIYRNRNSYLDAHRVAGAYISSLCHRTT